LILNNNSYAWIKGSQQWWWCHSVIGSNQEGFVLSTPIGSAIVLEIYKKSVQLENSSVIQFSNSFTSFWTVQNCFKIGKFVYKTMLAS